MIELVHARGIPVAGVVATGVLSELPGYADEPGEWIVSHRLPGRTLASAWPDLNAGSRRTIGTAIGALMRSLHQVSVDQIAPG